MKMNEWKITAALFCATVASAICHIVVYELFPPERIIFTDSYYPTSGPAQITWLIVNFFSLGTFISAVLATANSLSRRFKQIKEN
jgi:hypothetical protein